MKINKTNAMRELDKHNIEYEVLTYDHGKDAVAGDVVASMLDEDPEKVFKTLVTQANTKEYLVFMLPVDHELDLKKAAGLAGVKKVEMIPVKDITKITGYVRGGCSPLAMKKKFRTHINESVLNKDFIYFSGGKIGLQIKLEPMKIIKLLDIQVGDIIK